MLSKNTYYADEFIFTSRLNNADVNIKTDKTTLAIEALDNNTDKSYFIIQGNGAQSYVPDTDVKLTNDYYNGASSISGDASAPLVWSNGDLTIGTKGLYIITFSHVILVPNLYSGDLDSYICINGSDVYHQTQKCNLTGAQNVVNGGTAVIQLNAGDVVNFWFNHFIENVTLTQTTPNLYMGYITCTRIR
jgi:hypothetical protein